MRDMLCAVIAKSSSLKLYAPFSQSSCFDRSVLDGQLALSSLAKFDSRQAFEVSVKLLLHAHATAFAFRFLDTVNVKRHLVVSLAHSAPVRRSCHASGIVQCCCVAACNRIHSALGYRQSLFVFRGWPYPPLNEA